MILRKYIRTILTPVFFITVLVACQTPEVKEAERCLLDVENEACYCQGYEYTENHIGATSIALEMPLSYCEDYVAMPIEDFQRLRNAFREFYDIKKAAQ